MCSARAPCEISGIRCQRMRNGKKCICRLVPSAWFPLFDIRGMHEMWWKRGRGSSEFAGNYGLLGNLRFNGFVIEEPIDQGYTNESMAIRFLCVCVCGEFRNKVWKCVCSVYWMKKNNQETHLVGLGVVVLPLIDLSIVSLTSSFGRLTCTKKNEKSDLSHWIRDNL